MTRRPSSLRTRLASWARTFGPPTVVDYVRRVVDAGDCRTVVDIGCGMSSYLTRFRPGLKTIGIDAHPEAIRESQRHDVHDEYVVADVINMPAQTIRQLLADKLGDQKVDIVTAFSVIEHLPKHDGWKLLEKCEELSSKYIIVETPNGFLEQGPEFGNPFQRHLSGWFAHDFEGLGYQCFGTNGTKYLRGYMGQPRIPVPGTLVFDQVLLSRMIGARARPHHAFELVAVKDVRGVPARHASRDNSLFES